jgi:hypothetical protein
MEDFDWYTIEENHEFPGEYLVYGHGTYEASSVLAGQYRRCFIDSYPTLEAAQEKYPDAEVSGSTKYIADTCARSFENSPEPDWFDPGDAGEEW